MFGCKAKEQQSGFKQISQEPDRLWGEVSFDPKGQSEGRLIVPLDYVTSAPGGGASKLPVCLAPINEPAMIIGHLKCNDGAGQRVDLTAGHVHQECYSDKSVSPIAASRPIKLDRCKKASIYTYRFDPELRIDVEGRQDSGRLPDPHKMDIRQ